MEKLAVVLEVKTRAGTRDQVLAAWERHLRPQLESPDSAQELYLVCEHASDPDTLLLIELYDDPSRMQANARAPWFADYMREVAPLLDGQPRMVVGQPVWAKGIEL